MKRETKLTRRQIQQLKKRLDEKKGITNMRIDEEPVPDNSSNEDSQLLRDIRSVDREIDDFMKSLRSSS